MEADELRGLEEEDWYHSVHISQAASEGRTEETSDARRVIRHRPTSGSPTATSAFCALTRAECHEYGIGITVQHVVPVFMGGGDGPLVPFCARCQQASTAEQEKQRRIRERHGSMWDIIRRVERNHPELLVEEGG